MSLRVDGAFVGERLLYFGEKEANKEALADEQERLTYQQLSIRCQRIASLLRRLGLKKEDRVVVAAGANVPQISFHYGTLFAGAVPVPLAANLPPQRLRFFLDDTEAKFAITSDGIFDGHLSKVAELGDADGEPAFCDPLSSNKLAAIMYTTGSTGRPKGVMLPHRTILSALSHIIDYVGYQGTEREMVALPVSHSFGLGHVYCLHATGGFAFLMNGFQRMKPLFRILADEAISGMPATPTMCELLLSRYRGQFAESAQALKYMVVNSAPLPPETTKDLLSLFPRLRLMVYYGLTEASRSTFLTLSDEKESDYRSVGPPCREVEVEIQEGEVRIRGPHLFSGYWKQPTETAASLKDGWLRTGDTGTVDARGYLTLTGRTKDQINVAGSKASPAEIETVLKKHPDVRDAAVAGIPDPLKIRGEVVGALIVPVHTVKDETGFGNALREFCAQFLEGYMVPEVIRFMDRIPKSETGKVLREDVRTCLS